MRIRYLFIKIFIPIMILLIVAMTGCGQKKQDQEPRLQSLESEQKSDKIPEQLTGIEENIEKIFKELKGPAAEMEAARGKDEEKGGKEGEDAQSGEEDKKSESEGGDKKKSEEGGSKEGGSDGGSEQGGTSGGNEKEKQDKQQSKAATQPKQDPWTNITPIVNNLHYQWNSYMPMAAQKGANKALMDNFSKALNSLTDTIIGKNSTNTLMAASYLYAYVPDFYALYKTETSPEIKRIKYYTRNAMLNSWTANWTQAASDINALKSSWPIVKNTISKDQQDNSNKLDYSLYELEKVIQEKNQPLIDIKGRVALTNIMSIEQGMQKGKNNAGGSGDQSGGGESGGSESGGDAAG